MDYNKYYNMWKSSGKIFPLQRSHTGLQIYFYFYLTENDIRTLPNSIVKTELEKRKNLIRQYERNGQINKQEMTDNINSLHNTPFQIISLILKIRTFYKQDSYNNEQYLYHIPKEMFLNLIQKQRQNILVLPEDLQEFKENLLNLTETTDFIDEDTQITINSKIISIPQKKITLLRRLLTHFLLEEINNTEITVKSHSSFSLLRNNRVAPN